MRWYDDLVDWDTVEHPLDAALQITGWTLYAIGWTATIVLAFGSLIVGAIMLGGGA